MSTQTNKPLFILAPMDDVTDTVFRRIVTDCAAPDMTVTEFVNVDGLCSAGRSNLMRKLDTSLDTVPVYAQIWGKKPENFKTIAAEIAEGVIPGFSGIDINFGCPAKSEIRAGCCSALQKPELRGEARAMIEATLEGAGDFPVSFKTRLGFSEIDYSWHEFLLGFSPEMLTVHVRTTKQMSKVPAQWDSILPINMLRDKISPKTKIILNGDITNRTHGEELAKQFGVDGVMIGRGVFQDPYCFARQPIDSHTTTHSENSEVRPWMSEREGVDRGARVTLFIKHLELFKETYKNGERPFNPLKKFAKIYISDFPGAAELRDRIMHTSSVEEALDILP